VRDLVAYQPDGWTSQTPPTLQHHSHALVAGSNHRLYLLDAASEVFDGSMWRPLANPTVTRDSGAGVAQGGTILYIGGRGGPLTPLTNVDVLTTVDETWAPSKALAQGRLSPAVALDAFGHVLVMGGGNGSSALSSTEVYDSDWMSAGSLPGARVSGSAVTTPDGQVYFMGGEGGGPALDTVFTYCP